MHLRTHPVGVGLSGIPPSPYRERPRITANPVGLGCNSSVLGCSFLNISINRNVYKRTVLGYGRFPTSPPNLKVRLSGEGTLRSESWLPA